MLVYNLKGESMSEEIPQVEISPEDLQDNTVKTEQVVFNLDTPLQKKSTGMFLDKKTVLDNPTEFVIVEPVLDTDSFNKPFLCVEINGKPNNITVNQTHINQFIEEISPLMRNWINKKGIVTGKEWVGEVEGKQTKGVTLVFEFPVI